MKPWASLVAVMSVCACAARPAGPVDALRSYADALRSRRYEDAWRMLAREVRDALPEDAFERMARERPDEVAELVQRYGAIPRETPVTARLELPSGDVVTLVQESGRWRIDPSALDFYAQHTPTQALRSFLRALDRQRWEVLLQLAPRRVVDRLEREGRAAQPPQTAAERLRAAWTGPDAESVHAMSERLRAALNQGRPVEVLGDLATMTYGTHGQSVARLVREDGLWKIDDPE